MINEKPISKPACINFSSGPCAKRPGWSVNSLDNALLGRSHRSKEGKIKLKDAIDKAENNINFDRNPLSQNFKICDKHVYDFTNYGEGKKESYYDARS